MFVAGAETSVSDVHDLPWLFFLQDEAWCAKDVTERALRSFDIDTLTRCHDALRSNKLIRTVDRDHLMRWIAFLAAKEIEPDAVQWVRVDLGKAGIRAGCECAITKTDHVWT